ncbi:hypothetical protein DFJ63DRAFT_138810 [Scheffersomyces coipomensis]|uniref:uncharacterized protein n=1 Tax=Scheffersomyces coipomensis TaxID=1788519 RepID=UPI00315D2FBC
MSVQVERLNGDTTLTQNSDSLEKAFNDLCNACRTGDIEVVETLLSIPNLDVNQVDKFDYSPLILSSLCGHLKVVELLLSRGAVCDRDTFEGARCIYGALTDEIRDVLISFDVSKAVDLNQPFASHISSLLNITNEIITKDIIFQVGAENLKLNRFLLAARSQYFQNKLSTEWKEKSIINMTPEDYSVLKSIVNHLYLRTADIETEEIQDKLIQMATEFGLNDLADNIKLLKLVRDNKSKSKLKHDMGLRKVEKARKDLDTFLQRNILGEKLVIEVELPDEEELEDLDCSKFITIEQKQNLMTASSIPDIIVASIDYDTESIAYYPVNKSILARSEYYDTMLKSEIFLESNRELPLLKDEKLEFDDVINRASLVDEDVPIIRISTTSANSEVAEMILSYLYHDNIPNIPLNLTVELLFVADELFLDRLKTMCAVNISSSFDKFNQEQFVSIKDSVGYNIYDLVRVSWKTRSDKLEHHASKMIAHNLEYIYQNDKERYLFADLVRESANRIKERHETDTIELIDDIRYYLSKKYALGDEFEDLDPVRVLYKAQQKSKGEGVEEMIEPFPREELRIYKNARMNYERDIERIDTLLDNLQLDA